jgi:colanic acid/amylovoran biosynthesis glycosyltransferase
MQSPPALPEANLIQTRTRVDHAVTLHRTRKLKIAYLISQYPALSHTFIKKEVEAMEAAGHEVVMASIRKPANLDILGEEGIRDYRRTFYLLSECTSRVFPAFFRILFRGANLKCMAGTWLRVLRKRPFHLATYAYAIEALVLVDWMLQNDVKHVHNHFGNAAATVAMIAAASHLVDYSLSIHGPDIFYETDTELLGMKLSGSKFARSISHYSRSQMCLFTAGEHWPRFEIVRCGIDPEIFTPRPETGNHIPELLCVGRLVSAKGQRFLIEASQLLHEKGIKHTLTFVGNGPDLDHLKKLAADFGIADKISFPGGMNPEGVRSAYAKADIFVLPSLAEGVPVVLMEAMASGVPVISTAITGIPELIESGKEGILVPPSDPVLLAAAIQKIIKEPEKSRTMTLKARQKVLADYNLKKNGPGMAHLFEKYLGGIESSGDNRTGYSQPLNRVQSNSAQQSICSPIPTPSATIVICVESGPLETQSIWLVESLRRWGGRFAKCPVLAVTPRRGLGLDRFTLKRFKELDVQWIHFNGLSDWSFYGPFNKPLALAGAEEMSDSDIMIWMDSDMIVAGEPIEFELPKEVDFMAHPASCIYDIGSTGPEHDHEPFWMASLAGHGISSAKYPFIPAQAGEGEAIRMYWQAGAFAYRRKTNLGATFLQSTNDQMKIKVSSRHSGTYFHEQIGLAVAVHRQNLNYQVLDSSHNFAMNRLGFDRINLSNLPQAKVIHYFGSAWPDTFEEFAGLLDRGGRSDIGCWMRERGPLRDHRNIVKRISGRALRHFRSNKSARYNDSCEIY